MFEEDIFGDDTMKVILRFGDHNIDKFNKASKLMNFEKARTILEKGDRTCFFSRKDETRQLITIPISEDNHEGRIDLYVEWHQTNSYELKTNKECKSRFVTESSSIDTEYAIEKRCTFLFLDMKEQYNDFEAISELYKHKENVQNLEIAPTTIVENERQLWTKYVEAQRLIVKKLQEPFYVKGSPRLDPVFNRQQEIIRYKLSVNVDDSDEMSDNVFDEMVSEYNDYFDDQIAIDEHGTSLLTKGQIERVDTMIKRSFSESVGRFEKITCKLDIVPANIKDLLSRDFQTLNMSVSVGYNYDNPEYVYISNREKLIQKLPREIIEKYRLKLAGIFCTYLKTDEFGNRYYENTERLKKRASIFNIVDDINQLRKEALNQKKTWEENEDYKQVSFTIGQLYTYEVADADLDNDMWSKIKTELYGSDATISKGDSSIYFDVNSFDNLNEKIEFVNNISTIKLRESNVDKLKFKVRFYPIEKQNAIDSFEYKKDKLKNVEFITSVGKHKNVYIGNLNGRESTEQTLVFSIPFKWKDDKKKANTILKLFEEQKLDIVSVQANLKGDSVKLDWLNEAVEKLKESRLDTKEPNQKPVNPKLRDFIFDSSKAQPTYRFEVNDQDLENTEEYSLLSSRQLLGLNPSQKKAVLRALYAKDMCLLQGPPGTGKTTVIAELIWQHILKDSTNKLLLTSETNLAVDNALEKLMGSRNVNKTLAPFLSIIKPLRFGRASKFEEEGKKYAVERIEKWLDDEYDESFVYENEESSLANAEIDSEEEIEAEDLNNNAVQQWMSMIASRATSYADANPKYATLVNDYCSALNTPTGVTKSEFKEKYFKYANVIGSTCSSTGSPGFASDYARIYSSAIFDKYVAKEGYKSTISDIKRLINTAKDAESLFQDTAHKIVNMILKENNLKSEPELLDLLEAPNDNVLHILFYQDLRQLLNRKIRDTKFDTLLERLGFESVDEFDQWRIIHFDTVIMDEASKATPPDLVLPLCFGQKSIIIGDHRQLPPMLYEQDFKEALHSLHDEKADALADDIDKKFVETSQFARLIQNTKVSPSIKSVFTEQYRMHPQINDVIKQFYCKDEGGLTCGLNPDLVDDSKMAMADSRYHGINIPGVLNPKTHVLWINVDEPEMRTDARALYNEKEVVAVKSILRHLIHSEGFKRYMDYWDDHIENSERLTQEKEIGVISFYGQQVKNLREVKTYARQNGVRVKLNTVDKFQGMERNIVIVSTVRSNRFQKGNSIEVNNNPGFAESPERLNVALSRARRLLIIVGNYEFFDKVKDRNGNYLYHNVIEEIKKHHDIIDYKLLIKSCEQ